MYLAHAQMRRARGELSIIVSRQGMVWAAVVAAILTLAACSKPAKAPANAVQEAPMRTGLEDIPAPDPSKFPKFEDMSDWKNPYFVVRADGIGRVDLENHEIHMLTPEQIPAELSSLGSDAWPYGRVVLVTEAIPKDASPETKAQVRKNRALLAGTLKEIEIQMREFP